MSLQPILENESSAAEPNREFGKNMRQQEASADKPTLTKDEREKVFKRIMASNFNPEPRSGSLNSSIQSALTSMPDIELSTNAGAKLEDLMKLKHFELLFQAFQNHIPVGPKNVNIENQEEEEPQEAGHLKADEFSVILKKLLSIESENVEKDIQELFKKIDNRNTGYVDINGFVSYMLRKYWEKDCFENKSYLPFHRAPIIRICRHNHQEPTEKVVILRNPARYITFSKEGAFGVWDSDLTLTKTYKLESEVDQNPNKKMMNKVWVMDAVVMNNCSKLCIATTGRDLRFFDVSSSVFFEEFQLYGLSDVVTCLDYFCTNEFRSQNESLLVTGDDGGQILQFYFHQARNKLFEKPANQKSVKVKVYFQDLKKHSMCVNVEELKGKIHNEPVRRVKYVHENRTIISSSGSSDSSVVITDISGTRESYIWKIDKGVECFDLCRPLNLLATGSVDHFVKLWNQYITARTLTVLKGHNTTVVDVKILGTSHQVISYSEEACVKVWDIKDYACVQTIYLQFQCLDNRAPEHGNFPLAYFGSPYNNVVFTCNDYMAHLKIGVQIAEEISYSVTHTSPLCAAIYNSANQHIVTASDQSEIGVWDVTTGFEVTRFSKAHGDEEITCISFDSKGERLLSGGRDGSLHVWYYQSGLLSYSLQPAGSSEVTAIMHTSSNNKESVVACGWNRKIVSYEDTKGNQLVVKPLPKWKGGDLHKDDILSADICNHWLATASFDGELLLWNFAQEKLEAKLLSGGYDISINRDKILQEGTVTANLVASRPSTRCSSNGSRPSSRHRKTWRTPNSSRNPIEMVKFLKHRSEKASTKKATLVSSEAGCLTFWHCFSKTPLAEYYAASKHEQSVLSIDCEPEQERLITGDTAGFVSVWDISSYAVDNSLKKIILPPPLIGRWMAHTRAVCSVASVNLASDYFVVTSSVDCTARMWTIDGELLGTFGQKHKWNISDKLTWNSENLEMKEALNQDEVAAEKELSSLTNKSVETAADEVNEENDVALEEISEFLKHSDSREHLGDAPSLLGGRVEMNLIKRMKSRQNRRNGVINVDVNSTQRFGDICSPFQVLPTQSLQNDRVPANLPITREMRRAGFNISKSDDDIKRILFKPKQKPTAFIGLKDEDESTNADDEERSII